MMRKNTPYLGSGVLLLALSLSSAAYGQATGRTSLGGELRGMLKIRGTLLCADCSLDSSFGPGVNHNKLIELRHRQGKVVMQVDWTNEPQRWSNELSRRIPVRAKASLFQQLTAEENMFQEVELTTLLRPSKTLDVFDVTIRQERTPRQEGRAKE